MARTSFILFIVAIFFSFHPDINAQVNKLTKEEAASGWKLLFDGWTTNGWRGFRMDSMPEGWTVVNGCLMTSGTGFEKGGDIISIKEYEDFDLYLEWAISAAGNSGIFFHVLEGNYPNIFVTGPEYQLIDDAGYPDKLEEWQQTGANYAMHNADVTKKHLKPVGEFNSSRIRVKDGWVTHWLNGEKIVEYELWTDDWYRRAHEGKWKDYPAYGRARKGHIGLQDHGSAIYFRNIKIKDLTDPGKHLFNGKDLAGWVVYGQEKWYADSGILIGESGASGGYGYLATDRNYDNFLLRLEFKMEGPGNSGVFFRSILNGTDIKGWQVEIAPPGENTGGIYESGGRGWLAEIPDEKENILKNGEWNDLVILLNGNRVMTWLNGEMMTDLKDDALRTQKGVIALQVHSGGSVAVKWRNIMIHEMRE
jgi:hypothetical protein